MPGPVFKVFEEKAFDLNVSNNVSATWDVADFKTIAFQAELAGGTFAVAVIQAQRSADGLKFYNIGGKNTTGPGLVNSVHVGTEFFRVKVTTVEGVSGTANITVNAKV